MRLKKIINVCALLDACSNKQDFLRRGMLQSMRILLLQLDHLPCTHDSGQIDHYLALVPSDFAVVQPALRPFSLDSSLIAYDDAAPQSSGDSVICHCRDGADGHTTKGLFENQEPALLENVEVAMLIKVALIVLFELLGFPILSRSFELVKHPRVGGDADGTNTNGSLAHSDEKEEIAANG